MGVALLCLFVLLKAFALLLVFTVRTGISPVPTTPRVASAMFDLIPAGTRGVIYELGSGWGNLARGLAKRFPAASVVAYELSPLPWLFSRLWQRLAPRANLTIHLADFQKIGLDDAAVVCCYLYPGAMRRLAEKLVRAGTRRRGPGGEQQLPGAGLGPRGGPPRRGPVRVAGLSLPHAAGS